MAKKPICIVCREREATLLDRNEAPFGKRKKICSECHANRLKDDLAGILKIASRRYEIIY